MYPENTNDPVLNQRGEKPFEPTPMELRKQFNSLDSLIRMRSTELKDQQKSLEESDKTEDGNDGFLPPYNSAF